MKISPMKHFILNVLFVAGLAGIATAQNFRLNAYSAYTFNDRVDSKYSSSNYYDGTINGGYQWGLGVEYMITPSRGIELMYKRQDASVPMTYFLAAKRSMILIWVLTTCLSAEINISNQRIKKSNHLLELLLGWPLLVLRILLKMAIAVLQSWPST